VVSTAHGRLLASCLRRARRAGDHRHLVELGDVTARQVGRADLGQQQRDGLAVERGHVPHEEWREQVAHPEEERAKRLPLPRVQARRQHSASHRDALGKRRLADLGERDRRRRFGGRCGGRRADTAQLCRRGEVLPLHTLAEVTWPRSSRSRARMSAISCVKECSSSGVNKCSGMARSSPSSNRTFQPLVERATITPQNSFSRPFCMNLAETRRPGRMLTGMRKSRRARGPRDAHRYKMSVCRQQVVKL
jgi:hypothetical protein